MMGSGVLKCLPIVGTMMVMFDLIFPCPAVADDCDSAANSGHGGVTCAVSQPGAPAAPVGPAAPGVPAAPGDPGDPGAGSAGVVDPGDAGQKCVAMAFGGFWPIGCESGGREPLPELTPEAGAGVDVAGLVSRASLGLEVPSPTIRLAPEPEWNQWQVLAVGLPIWLWTADVDPQSAATSQEGIDIAMQATAGGAVVDWGDGTVGYCATMTPRARVADPVLKSPDCGHVYEHPGDYTITVTQYWGVDWAALGQQGRLELQSAASRVLPIRNFSSVVVG